MKHTEEYLQFLKNRITYLIELNDISEYQLSMALGKNKSYINKITSGKTFPSMREFINICEYFNVEPHDFFNENIDLDNIGDTYSAAESLKYLDPVDLRLISDHIKRLLRDKVD